MGKIFRGLRKSIFKSNSIKSYLLYALGEIVLVVIGILIALQVNNWNQQRKNNHQEQEIYQNFLNTLKKDSADLAFIAHTFKNGFEAQKYFINTSAEEVLKQKSIAEIEQLILRTTDVSHSFFPRYGIYQEVLNNGEFAFIRSHSIKNQLTEIYERRYKLYEHVDATVEEKIHFDLQPVVKGQYLLFLPKEEITNIAPFTPELFKQYYDNFTYRLRNMYSILGSTQKIIGVMQENIHEGLNMLRKEAK